MMSESKSRNDTLDRLADIAEKLKNRQPIGWRPLVERYIDGDARIHVHLWQRETKQATGDRNVIHSPDLCVTFEFPAIIEWPRGASGDDFPGTGIRESLKRSYREHITEFNGNVDQMKVAMLVDVPEFLEHVQLFTLGDGVLPSVKRLQLLDGFDECLIDRPELVPYGRGPLRISDTNRERDGSPRISGWDGVSRGDDAESGLMLDAECPDELVEGGAIAVADVSDDRPPVQGGRLHERLREDNHQTYGGIEWIIPDVSIHVDPVSNVNFVSLSGEGTNKPLQGVDVRIRPLDFRSGIRLAAHVLPLEGTAKNHDGPPYAATSDGAS